MGKLSKLAGALKKAADIPDQVMVDGVMRATRNAKGQLIHPTSEGIENFWRWYGNSPMDEAGRPLVQYHGTAANIRKFEPFPISKKHKGDFGVSLGGTFTTPDSNMASKYAEGAGRVTKDPLGSKEYFKYSGANVMPVYVKTERPWILDKTGQKASLYNIHDDINRRVIGYNPDGTVKFSGPPLEGEHDSILIRNWQDMGPTDYDQYRITDPTSIKSAVGNTGKFSPDNEDILGAATIGGMATAGAVGAGAMAAQQYDFGTPDYDAKIQEFRNRRDAKSQIWKELKEAGATIASAIPAGIISDAYRFGGYLSPVTPVEETERGAEIVQNALMYTPEGDNRYLNEFARQVNQFGQDVEPLVNAWKQTPIYRGYKQLPQRIQGLIRTASDYAF